jgi:putative nucleotide binding protein
MPPKTERADKKEVEAVVLDFLQWGYADDKRPSNQRGPIILAVGTDQFKLLELIPKRNFAINLHDKVYIGDGERKVVERVKRRISHDELTNTAKGELEPVISMIIAESEPRFVKFYNEAVPISLKLHMLNLLPGFGKKTLTDTLTERQKKPFESFEDIRSRVKTLAKPEKFILERIMLELENPDEKYHLFTSK